MASLLFHRGMSDLVEDAAKIAVPLGRTAAVVLLCTFLFPRAGSHPGCQMSSRSKGAGLYPYLGDDLLSRVHPETGNCDQTLHCLLMLFHGLADHDLQLLDLLLDQLVALEIKP